MLELLLATAFFMVFAVALSRHVGSFLCLQQGNGVRIDRLSLVSDALERPQSATVTRRKGVHQVHCEYHNVSCPQQFTTTGALDEMLVKRAFQGVAIKQAGVAMHTGLPALSLVMVTNHKQ